MISRRVAVTLWLLACSIASVAANDGEKLLAELMDRARANASIAGTFTQKKHIEGLPLALESSGVFSYSSEAGVTWHTTTPLDSMLHISATGLRYDGGEAVPGSSVLAETLLGIFSGDLSNLARYFATEVSGEALDWQVRLLPRSAAVADQVATITMSGAHFTRHISIIAANGDTTEISLQTEPDNGAENARQ